MANGACTPEEESARECGLRLLAVSGIYERAVVGDAAGATTLAIVGLVARQRRLLRAAYLLADAGMRLEASYMVRAMTEFLIRQKWLEADPQRNQVLWALDDLEARLRIDQEIRELLPGEHGEAVELMLPDVRAQYEREIDRMREQMREAPEGLGGERPRPRYPNLREQARAGGLDVPYSLAYRFDSLLAHPTPYAIEQLLEQHEHGVQVMPDPPPDRGYADPYSVCAFILRDAIASAAALVPELQLDGFDEVAARLEELARPEAAEAPRGDARG